MTEKFVPLTTEHLRIIREDIHVLRDKMGVIRQDLAGVSQDLAGLSTRVDSGFSDIKKRLARVEQTIIGLKRDETETAAELTEHRHTLDEPESVIKEVRARLDVLESRTAH